MLKQVSLSVRDASPFRELAQKHASAITVVECKQLDSRGILLLVEIEAPDPAELMGDLRMLEGVRRAYWAGDGARGALALLTMDTPLCCGISGDSGALCIACPLSSSGRDGEERSWKILVRGASTVAACIGELERHNISARVSDVSNATYKDLLTRKQREVVEAAVKAGYFCFPRETGLTPLAKELSMTPATLSEILRRAEAKIVQYYLDALPLSRRVNLGAVPKERGEYRESVSAPFVPIG